MKFNLSARIFTFFFVVGLPALSYGLDLTGAHEIPKENFDSIPGDATGFHLGLQVVTPAGTRSVTPRTMTMFYQPA